MTHKYHRYSKIKFIISFILLVFILAAISHLAGISPLADKRYEEMKPEQKEEKIESEKTKVTDYTQTEESADSVATDSSTDANPTSDSTNKDTSKSSSIYGFVSDKVWSYQDCFPDSNSTQLAIAAEIGVKPMKTKQEVFTLVKKHKLTDISSSPYYCVEELTHSMPYLVPKAQILLNTIGINFIDSLNSKGFQLHIPVITSVLRTADDIKGLQKGNNNSVTNSCHCYGTTIDITYNRFMPINGNEPTRYDENLKKTLAEVLYDLRSRGKCYVKYEKNQACFHLTVI